MTKPRLLVVFALGGFLLAVHAVGAGAQMDDTPSLGMSYPGASSAGSEKGPAARQGRDTDSEDEVKRSGEDARRAPCDRVMSRYNSDPNLSRGHAVDLSTIATELHTGVMWVERCVLAYGKPVHRSHLQSTESAEDRLEALEEDEPEESAPEEIDAGREPSEHGERPRVLKNPSKRVPTPETGFESPE